jgi:hypothetical protein
MNGIIVQNNCIFIAALLAIPAGTLIFVTWDAPDI